MTQTVNTHGVQEVNGLNGKTLNRPTLVVDWSDRRLKAITRLRLLSDPGLPFWDVSYCDGVLHDGTEVRVELPFSQMPRARDWKRTWAFLYTHGKACNVYVNRILNQGAISTLV